MVRERRYGQEEGEKRSGQNLQELSPGLWKVTVNLPASQNTDGMRHRQAPYV